jgi:hypothetical protein
MDAKLIQVITQKEEQDMTNHLLKRTTVSGLSFEFIIINAKSKEEHLENIESFKEYLKENKINSFISGTWENSDKTIDGYNKFFFLTIPFTKFNEQNDIDTCFWVWKDKNAYED